MDVSSEDEALAYLAQRTGLADADNARELAAELGNLPLAQAQATAVISVQHLDYQTYLSRLRALPVQEYLKRSQGEPYRHGVAEAILLAFDAVTDQTRATLCRGLFDAISLLSSDGVPRILLYAAGQAGLLHQTGESIATGARGN